MIKLQLLTAPGCSHCAQAKAVLEKVKKDYPDLQVKEIDMTTPEGQEMVTKYQIMSSPGVVINGELFSTGGLDEKKLREKLEEFKGGEKK